MRAKQHGFTLIELMIVVVILGVLAAIAIPVFSGYIRRGKAAEAYAMLNEIRMKEETYRQSYGRYMGVGDWFPGDYPEANPQPWAGNAAVEKNWRMLGITPTGKNVYFQYRVGAGGPNVEDLDPDDVNETGISTDRHWWYAQARGDLDGDSEFSFFELTSQREDIFTELPTE